jgi:hypothetical protein
MYLPDEAICFKVLRLDPNLDRNCSRKFGVLISAEFWHKIAPYDTPFSLRSNRRRKGTHCFALESFFLGGCTTQQKHKIVFFFFGFGFEMQITI